MFVAITGYNAAGKSTLIRMLEHRLEESGVPYKFIKFDRLFPSHYLKKKVKKETKLDAAGTVDLRRITGQQGKWRRHFGLYHFCNTLMCIAVVSLLRLFHWQTVILSERFFWDRYIHFDESGMLYKVAQALTPHPNLAFFMLPEQDIWEKRMAERLRERFGLKSFELSVEEKNELRHVRERFTRFAESTPCAMELDATSSSHEAAWARLSAWLNERRKITAAKPDA